MRNRTITAFLVFLLGVLVTLPAIAQADYWSADMEKYFKDLGVSTSVDTKGDQLIITQQDINQKQSTQYRVAFTLEVLQAYLKKNGLSLSKLKISTVTVSSADKINGKLLLRDRTMIKDDFLESYFTLPTSKKPDALWKEVWQPMLQQETQQQSGQ